MIPLKTNLTYSFVSVLLSLAILLYSCGKASNQTEQAAIEDMEPETPPEPAGLVEVKAVGLTLQARDTIPSGWTTFRFINASDMIHLAYIYKLPEGIGLEDHKKLAAVFQNFMDEYNGRPHSEPAAGMEIPEWFSGVIANGGPGLVSPKNSCENIVYMEPGVYFIECYVKTDGIFHSYNSSPTQHGMIHKFTVTNEDNRAPEPEPTLNISVSGETGMEINGEITAGNHIVRITFPDQKPHENFQGHDVHLLRLTEDTNLNSIVKWMDWRDPAGLQTPAPAGLFLGGTNELPAGKTAYFKIKLEPGDYALISEVPDADQKGLLVQFEIAAAL